MSESPFVKRDKRERLRVLIADDAKETRRSARLMMTLIPAVEVVAVAENGRQALQMSQQYKPDIALIDINMPEMDGLSAVRAIMNQRPEMACVIMSAHRDSEVLREAMASGARGYLIKPFTTDQLVEVMDGVIKMVHRDRQRFVQTAELRQQRDVYLVELAGEYVKTRRMDDKAREVFEQLAADPHCEARWLIALATIYLLRKNWRGLKILAARLEKMSTPAPTPSQD